VSDTIAIWASGAFVVIGFSAVASLLRLGTRARSVIDATSGVLRDLGDPGLDDDAKEAAMRRHAGRLFLSFLQLTLIGATSVGAPIGVLWLVDRVHPGLLHATLELTMHWPFLLASTVAVLIVLSLRAGRMPAPTSTGFQNQYTSTERLLHETAFAIAPAQLALGDLEERLFRRRLAAVPARAPVFVTALPRAGTTLLLELCVATKELGSHTYRDMPFVLMPMLWDRFARRFRVKAAARERAHGDGMMVDVDSPEAFEEILWRRFWAGHYRPDRIAAWRDDERDPEFCVELRSHLRKIVALRRQDEPTVERYVSKNNLNIARVATLSACLPDAIIVVLFRDPVQHALSLLRQHKNFLDIHGADPFARRYMADIGHFDFGDNLRPVDFDGWLDRARCRDATQLGFWLEYWSAAYAHLIAVQERLPAVRFLSYDALTARPEAGLAAVAKVLELDRPEALVAQHARLRVDPPRDMPPGSVEPTILAEAQRVRAELDKRALAF